MAKPKKPKKPSKSLLLARKLAKSKYAPVLKELEDNANTNTTMYNSAGSQRKESLDRELGSISAAGATTQKNIAGYAADTGNLYQQAMSKSQSDSALEKTRSDQANTALMSSLESERVARGLSGSSGMQADAAKGASQRSDATSAMQAINEGALTRQGLNAQDSFKNMQASNEMLSNTAKSGARGTAQANMQELYTNWLGKKQELETALAKVTLEKQDYENSTYLTLKDKAAQAKAEAQQQALQAALAQGNLAYKYDSLAANTQYKNDALATNTQYKYDSLAQKTAKETLDRKLKRRGLRTSEAKALSDALFKQKNFDFDVEKFNWKKAQPKTGPLAVLDPAAWATLANSAPK